MASYQQRKQDPAIILSVDRSDRTPEENETMRAAFTRAMDRQGYSYKAVDGMYQGTRETSYVVPLARDEQTRRAFVTAWATASQQDSILYLSPDRDAYSVDPRSSDATYLGHWVTEWTQPTGDAWTGETDGSQYYRIASPAPFEVPGPDALPAGLRKAA